MRILGIDPSTRVVGYSLLEQKGTDIRVIDYGVLKVSDRFSLARRLKEIYQRLQSLYKRLRPDGVVVEDVFYARDARATIKLGEARGIALLFAELHHLPVYEYTPATIKKAITGNGRADKSQVQKMVQQLLSLKIPPKSYDASDALAIALCHLYRL